MQVVEVFAAAPQLRAPVLHGSERALLFAELCCESGLNFLGGDLLVPEKGKDHSKLVSHENCRNP
jgi:hypothetical protein